MLVKDFYASLVYSDDSDDTEDDDVEIDQLLNMEKYRNTAVSDALSPNSLENVLFIFRIYKGCYDCWNG